MRGRKPVPTHLRLITDNPGKRSVDTSLETALDVMRPDRPEFLNARAQAEWDRIVPHLERAGLLTKVDRAALALYCNAFARWQFAEEMINKAAAGDDAQLRETGGLIVKAKNDFEQLSQWQIVSNRAQEQLLKYLVEFGMTPSARARVKALGAQGSLFPGDDPMEGVLGASAHAGVR